MVNPGSGPALVRFEVGQIEQILLDLAVRAREGMPTGGTFTVTVCEPDPSPPTASMLPVAQEIGNWIEVRVTGTGRGLDAQWLAWCREPGESGRYRRGQRVSASEPSRRRSGGAAVM